MRALFATDDFVREDEDEAPHVNREIEHFTGGTAADYDDLELEAALTAADTNDGGVAYVDPGTYSNIIAGFRGILEAHRRGELLTADEIAEAELLLASAPSSLTVATGPTVVDAYSTGTSERGGVVSPLSIPGGGPGRFPFRDEPKNNGYGDAMNGLSPTRKALACFLQRLRDRDHCPGRAQLDALLTGEWGAPVEAPRTLLEQALTGCFDWEKHIEILRVVEAGAEDVVAIVRSKKDPHFRAALKVLCFLTARELVDYLSREIIDETKVKSRHLARCLGYFPILSVEWEKRPYCIGLLHEECHYNLDSLLPHHQESRQYSPRETARLCCDDVNRILKGARDLARNGIVHGNITSKNVWIGKDGYLKITRGLGKGHIPPESSGGPKHDVFSCAVVWYELLAGKLPWVDEEKKTKLVSPKTIAATFMVDVIPEGKQMMDLFLKMIEFNEAARLTAEEASLAMEAIVKLFSE